MAGAVADCRLLHAAAARTARALPPRAQGGVAAMALSAAATYAPKNIRVNCVAPGLTRTPMTAKITGAPGPAVVRLVGVSRSIPNLCILKDDRRAWR